MAVTKFNTSNFYAAQKFNRLGAAFAAATVNPTVSIQYLIVAGGAAGGGGHGGGGGGAGGYLTNTETFNATSYTLTVGAGGFGSSETRGTNGSNSVFASLTAIGGGAGDGGGLTANTGGSGGGGSGSAVYNGGTGTNGSTNYGGGGGGCGGANNTTGGSGIVLIRYSNSGGQRATGGTVTNVGGYYIHTFTGTGTFTVT